ncbi:hypothetical protein [Streptomyces sp. NPDC047043]|uniref:hypothetical protein n=1 Tax=Streptomyces sp. NPDC047043 TaxID=3154497 RepID=UPI0033CAF54F
MRTTAPAADPAGYAQLFVSAWLRSNAAEATSAQTRRAQSLAPDSQLPNPVAGAHTTPQSVTAVRSTQRGDGAWSVTVAGPSEAVPSVGLIGCSVMAFLVTPQRGR